MDSEDGERGHLVVRDKVVQRLAVTAALRTPGVRAHATGLGKLTGHDFPDATVQVAGNRTRVHVDIAVCWGQSLPQVAAAVQHNVLHALSTYAGFTVEGVDVAIGGVVTDVARVLR